MEKDPKSKRIYASIGNFLFLAEKQTDSKAIEFIQAADIESNMKISDENCFSFKQMIEAFHHRVDHYKQCLAEWSGIAKFEIGEFYYPPNNDGYDVPTFIPRVVKEHRRFQPLIQDAEVIRVMSEDGKPDRLRLQLTGQNLLQIVLEQSNFNFGFPFPRNHDKCQVQYLYFKTNVMGLHTSSLIISIICEYEVFLFVFVTVGCCVF